MGFYSDWVLPLLNDWSLGSGSVIEQRIRAVEGLKGTVLEVGLGSGLNLPHYPPEVERVLSVEPSPGMRRRAAKRIREARFPVEFIDFDRDGRYPLEDGAVDAVLTTWVLCTLPDPASALAEFRRVLKPGGAYHFLEHGESPDAGMRKWQNRLNPLQNAVGGGCNLNRPIDRIVGAAGFAEVDLERYPFPKAPRLFGDVFRGIARN